MLKDVYSYLLSENLLDYLPVSQVEDSMTRIIGSYVSNDEAALSRGEL